MTTRLKMENVPDINLKENTLILISLLLGTIQCLVYASLSVAVLYMSANIRIIRATAKASIAIAVIAFLFQFYYRAYFITTAGSHYFILGDMGSLFAFTLICVAFIVLAGAILNTHLTVTSPVADNSLRAGNPI